MLETGATGMCAFLTAFLVCWWEVGVSGSWCSGVDGLLPEEFIWPAAGPGRAGGAAGRLCGPEAADKVALLYSSCFQPCTASARACSEK